MCHKQEKSRGYRAKSTEFNLIATSWLAGAERKFKFMPAPLPPVHQQWPCENYGHSCKKRTRLSALKLKHLCDEGDFQQLCSKF
jgi:hypothetical protein